MTKQEFISNVVNELVEDKFNVFLHSKDKVEDCGGWFDSNNREFIAAMDNPMGFEIFVHEYCHYRQWKDSKDWFETKLGGNGIFFGWIDGDKYSPDIVELAWRDTVALEVDCENQAVWMIEEYDLPVDLDRYKRAANAYLLCYQYIKENRLWTKKSPYNNENILKLVPNELKSLDYYLDSSNISEELGAEFETCFIE